MLKLLKRANKIADNQREYWKLGKIYNEALDIAEPTLPVDSLVIIWIRTLFDESTGRATHADMTALAFTLRFPDDA